jgi:hypothetical protein
LRSRLDHEIATGPAASPGGGRDDAAGGAPKLDRDERIFEPGRQEGPLAPRRRLNDCEAEHVPRILIPQDETRSQSVRRRLPKDRHAHLLSAVPQEAFTFAQSGEDCHRRCPLSRVRHAMWNRPSKGRGLRSRPLPVGRALWSYITRNPDLGMTDPVACALTLRPRRLACPKGSKPDHTSHPVGNPTGRHRPGCDDDIDIALRVTGVAVHGARLGHA